MDSVTLLEARKLALAKEQAATPRSLEWLLTDPSAFGLVGASKLQRAIARGADGLTIAPDDFPARAFGFAQPTVRPRLVAVIAGIRSGKTLMAGVAAWRCATNADLSQMRPNEVARVAIVAPTVDNATATFQLLAGALEAPALAPQVQDVKAGVIRVRREDGKSVEIVVVAAHRGAVTLRSRWLAGFVFDEVALFGQDDLGYSINAEELLRGAEPRLLPQGQGWLISSPYGSQGLLYDLWQQYFGKPGRVLVVHAPTVEMNPAFDRTQVEELRLHDPDTAAREYDAAWTDPEQALLPAAHVDAATRPERGPEPLHHYAAAMDPGTRSNAWTLAIRTRRIITGKPVESIVKVRQWQGSKAVPLSPDAVLKEIAAELLPYGIRDIVTDQWAADALRDIARRHGLNVYDVTITSASKLEMFEGMRNLMADGAAEIPVCPQLRSDLLLVKKVIGRHGVSVVLPHTPDGRHCDYAMVAAQVLAIHVRDPDRPEAHAAYGSPQWYAEQAAKEKEKAIRESMGGGKDRPWFAR